MKLSTAIAQGLIGGAAGAGCMSTLRMAARRLGWIDATPPQAVRDWLGEHVGAKPEGPGSRQLVDAFVHLAISLGGGMAYGALTARTPRTILVSGPVFGLSLWALAFGVLLPQLGVTRSPRQARWSETAINAGAHIVYGVATALVSGQLRGQTHGADAGIRALRARVG